LIRTLQMRDSADTRPFTEPLVQYRGADAHVRTRTEKRFALPRGDFATANDKDGTVGQVDKQWIQLHLGRNTGE
jgi:hypothetical protein